MTEGSFYAAARLANTLTALLLLLLAVPASGQERVLEGRVLDAVTGEPVAGAVVAALPGGRGTLTDRQGRFRLAAPPGTTLLRATATGFLPAEAEVRGGSATLLLERAVLALEGVVVTASPLGGTARYQPAQALGAEALQRRAATALGEMLDGEPGVAMRSMGPAPARPVIRGLDGDRVLVLQNGERMGDLSETAPDHAVTSDPLAIERVEVVRGPASLLYGSSALGGVVNVLSPDIPHGWSRGASGALALQGASVNETRAGFARLLHGADDWAVAARGAWRAAGDVRTPAGRLDGTHLESASLGAGAALKRGGGEGGVALAGIRQSYGIPEELELPLEGVELHTARATLQGRWRQPLPWLVEEAELRFAAADYRHEEIELERRAGLLEEEVEHAWRRRTLSLTLQGRHRPLGVFGEGAAGAHLHLQSLEAGGAEALTPDGRMSTAALFLYQEKPISPALRFQAGARWELQGTRALPNPHFPGAGGRSGGSVASGSLGMHLRLGGGAEAGVQLARAHRAPSLEELYSDGPHLGTARYEVGDPGLGHEIGHGVDVVLGARLGAVEGELTLFANRIEGFVHLSPAGEVDAASGLPVYRYAASRALLTGGEARLGIRVSPAVRLRLDADNVRGARLGEEGEPLPGIPPLRGRATLEGDAGVWFWGGTLRLVAAQDRVARLEHPTPGYALLGGELGFRLGVGRRHTLVLRGDNLLDAEYRDHLSQVSDRNRPMAGRNLTVVYRLAY